MSESNSQKARGWIIAITAIISAVMAVFGTLAFQKYANNQTVKIGISGSNSGSIQAGNNLQNTGNNNDVIQNPTGPIYITKSDGVAGLVKKPEDLRKAIEKSLLAKDSINAVMWLATLTHQYPDDPAIPGLKKRGRRFKVSPSV